MQSPPRAAQVARRVGPYEIEAELGRGGMGSVFRARHVDTSVSVALKSVRFAQPRAVAALQREIHALSALRHPGVVRIFESGVEDSLPWYAMELLESDGGHAASASGAARGARTTPITDGQPRSAVRARSSQAPTARRLSDEALVHRLTYVRRLCVPLAYLHGRGIVHGDLKPENVLFRADGLPVLADFGLVSRFATDTSREHVRLGGERLGTALYMAPELSLAGDVDARADLYSLGCMLYELLTGAPPFVAYTLHELVHLHAHAPVCSPSERVDGLPDALVSLVLGLLEKRPERRIGYALDVIECLDGLGADTSYPEADAPVPYVYPPPLCGREALLTILEDIDASLRIVRGESGMGKTRLLRELAQHARNHGVEVLVGEANARGARPLEPFRSVLASLAARCRARGRDESELLFGSRGPVLAAFEPSIAALADQAGQREPLALPPDATRARLLSSLRTTLEHAASERGLLVILDDVQWADELSLAFIRHAARHPLSNVCFVVAVRSEETPAVIAEVLSQSPELALDATPLARAELEQALDAMLGGHASASELGELLLSKAGGSPFFLGEWLRALLHEGVLERRARRFVVRSEHAQARLLMPAQLEDLVGHRLDSLSSAARTLVDLASVLGQEAQLSLLQMLASEPGERALSDHAMLSALHELSLREMAVVRDEHLVFCHDKLREGAYARLSPERKRKLHEGAAHVLKARGTASDVYAIARHWVRGRVEAHPEQAYRAACRAGQAALDEGDAHQASLFYEAAARVADAHELGVGAVDLGNWGESLVRQERWAEAASILEDAVAQASDPLERAGYRTRLAFVLITWPRAERAFQHCVQAFTELLSPYPTGPRALGVVARDVALALLAEREPTQPELDAREHTRLVRLAALYRVAMAAGYYRMDATSWLVLGPRALLPAARLGPSAQKVEAHAAFAVGMASFQLRGLAERYSRGAIAMAAALDDPYARAIAELHRGNTLSFQGRSEEAVAQMQRVLEEHVDYLSGPDSLIAAGELIWNLMIRGHAERALAAQQFVLQKLDAARSDHVLTEGHSAQAQLLVFMPVLGLEDEAHAYLERATHLLAADDDEPYNRAFIHCHEVALHCELGELGAPLELAITRYREVSPSPAMTLVHLRAFYVFQAYARLSQLLSTHGEDWLRGRDLTRAALAPLARASKELTRAITLPRMPVLEAHHAVLRAALLHLRGDTRAGHAALQRAEQLATHIDAPWVTFEALRLRHWLALRGGNATASEAAATEAVALARQNGWVGRLARGSSWFPGAARQPWAQRAS